MPALRSADGGSGGAPLAEAGGPGPPPWAEPAEAAAVRLGVDPRVGLDGAAARARLATHGPNRLREVRPPSPARLFVKQFRSLIVALLAAAAVAAFAFGEVLDGSAILAVLLLNALIGFGTELRAVRSMQALRSLGSVRARVRRDGRELELPATELVPGDVALFEAGDVVTADVRVAQASRLEADESTLTGESVPVVKDADPVAREAPLAERASMLFKGTAVTSGSAEGLVVATGMATELGRIADLVEGTAEDRTPLEERLSSLGGWLIWATLAIAVLTSVLGIAAGKPALLMVETGIALAVAAIPEGLPIVATMALARGMWRMARRRALVNRLAAVETLGATTLVCTDKTGTLTENRMAVRSLVLPAGTVDLDPAAGAFRAGSAAVEVGARPDLARALEALVLCNNATLAGEGAGDPLEVALLRAGRAAGLKRAELLRRLPEVRQDAFDATRRRMATLHAEAGAVRVAAKGAAERVLADCAAVADGADGAREARPWRPGEREAWLERAAGLAGDGLRVLGVAEGRAASADADAWSDLAFLGLVALLDPPRADVRASLDACRRAGLRVVMVTGDHAATAASIARAVGLVEADARPGVVTGAELELALADAPERVRTARIFARVTPEQKLDLVRTYQEAGEVVAMTGDGVNDAPALRKADIGVAMGQRGTQVAREAADMVLTDDSFAAIVAAVAEGRVIFDNIRKFVLYLLSCNLSEVAVVALASVLGGPLPLLPLQILFLNLVTDVFPALALAFGRGERDVLERPPRDPREPILTRRGWLAAGGFALAISATVLAALWIALEVLELPRDAAVTVSFLTLAFAQLGHVLDVRVVGSDLVRNEVTRNPWVWGALGLCTLLLLAAVHLPGLGTVLRTTDPGPTGWLLVLAASLAPVALSQTALAWLGHRRHRSGAQTTSTR